MKKTCAHCGVEKDLTEFRKDSRKRSGRGSYCKPCSSEIAKRWARNNPEKAKQRDRDWYAKNKDRKKASDAVRATTYRARRQEIDRARWLAMTPEQRRDRWASWYRKNKEHHAAYKRARSAASRSLGCDWAGDPQAVEYVKIILRDPCVYCGQPATIVDHIEPVASGGSGCWVNLAPACRSCNSAKRHTDLLQFLLRQNGIGRAA